MTYQERVLWALINFKEGYTDNIMDQNSKDSLMIWAGTILGAAGGWWGATRLAARYAVPLGAWGVLAGGVVGAIAGSVLTKKIVNDPGAMPQFEEIEQE